MFPKNGINISPTIFYLNLCGFRNPGGFFISDILKSGISHFYCFSNFATCSSWASLPSPCNEYGTGEGGFKEEVTFRK